MAELKKVWLVRDADPSVLDDPAIENEDAQLEQFSDPKGHDIDEFMRIAFGTRPNTWWAEHTKLYTDAASARKDAKQRLAKLKSHYKQGYSYDRG